jgi:hypothetical protein
MSTPVLPAFWFHGDIVDLQTRLQAGLDQTNGSTVGCAKLDAATAANWASFYKLASGFCHEPAAWLNTGQQADVGQNYENQLIAWQRILNPICPLSGPSYKRPGDTGDADIASTIKWLVAGLSVVAVAYAVGQVAGATKAVEAK